MSNKAIKINETELCKIIKESVDKVLGNQRERFASFINELQELCKVKYNKSLEVDFDNEVAEIHCEPMDENPQVKQLYNDIANLCDKYGIPNSNLDYGETDCDSDLSGNYWEGIISISLFSQSI